MQGGLFGHDDQYRTDLLIKHGFTKKNDKGEDVADEEVAEIWPYRYTDVKTGFPMPMKTFHLTWEVPDLSIEEPYFWYLQEIQYTFPIIEKLEDSLSASEHSAVFGVTQQRLGAQQDKVSQFLATTGKMIKELFQMVRELRIIDERLTYYREADQQLSKELKKRSKGAEITLKGIFIDLVQGGGKSAASVYGMARELEFITLPDLFFDIPPLKNQHELDSYVKNLEENFNRNLVRVLHRHQRQYMEWKKRTHVEHDNRRRFMLQYLLQHFEIIKMYINWVKPYLKHVARMTLNDRNLKAPDIIAAFEGSIIDIEFLARKPCGHFQGCILASFRYRTRSEMKVVQDGYQRGPVHIGKFEMQIRTYVWTEKQVEAYKKLKEEESMILMGNVSKAVEEAMNSLSEELDKYLEEARGQKKEVPETAEKTKNTFMQAMFGDFYRASPKTQKPKKKSRKQIYGEKKSMDSSRTAAKGHAQANGFIHYKNFKKAHGMVMW